ncbi:unnamed protein product [Periconia digitata]|uniref:Uncharacterized protein n=1 Tax=Periconia digitata TaxID=1303443 RepID=A0A9W4UGE4_9PLEO|nr:unnamed protein product [Periconia digitata]
MDQPTEITKRDLISALPDELLLLTIENLKFNNGETIRTLARTDPHLAHLIRTYERSITKSVLRNELPHAQYDFPPTVDPLSKDDPSPKDAETRLTYTWLRYCIDRYDTIDDIMALLTARANCVAIARHNMPLVYSGMLLLYRLSTLSSTASKLAFLTSLPQDPLTAIYLAIHTSLESAQYFDTASYTATSCVDAEPQPSLLHYSRYGVDMAAPMLSYRADMMLAFREAALALDPDFILATLRNDPGAQLNLLNVYHDVAAPRDWAPEDLALLNVAPVVTAGPVSEGGGKSVLWDTLVSRLAGLMGCEGKEVESCVVERVKWVAGNGLAWLGVLERYGVVGGVDVDAR